MRYRVIYTDSSWDLDSDNIFLSSQSYKDREDWEKNSDMYKCPALVMLDSSLPNVVGLANEVMEQLIQNHKNNKKDEVSCE